MDKRPIFRRIAIEAGIKSPDVKYDRRTKTYTIRIIIPNPKGMGYLNSVIGSYATSADAKQHIEDDLRTFVQNNPSAQDEVTIIYENVTDPKTNRQTMLVLLNRIIDSGGSILISEADKKIAQAILAILPSEAAQGKYQSIYPVQEKHPVEWTQPIQRNAPVWEHEVTCPYCSVTKIIKKHSANPPPTCGEEECRYEHNKLLARERKREQRARDKAVGRNRKHQ